MDLKEPEMKRKEAEIQRHVSFLLNKIIYYSSPKERTAYLAKLSHSLGKDPWNADLSSLVFLWDGMPSDLFEERGILGKAEWSIYLTMTLYAWHQQGKELPAHCMHRRHRSLGRAMSQLADDKDSQNRYIKKLDQLTRELSGKSMSTMSYQLRRIIALLKGKDIPLDYVELAGELYEFQCSKDSAANVRLKWGYDLRTKPAPVTLDNKTEKSLEDI